MARLGEIAEQLQAIATVLNGVIQSKHDELRTKFSELQDTVAQVWPAEGCQVEDFWQEFEELKEEVQAWIASTRTAFKANAIHGETLVSQSQEMLKTLMLFVQTTLPRIDGRDAFDPFIRNLTICSTPTKSKSPFQPCKYSAGEDGFRRDSKIYSLARDGWKNAEIVEEIEKLSPIENWEPISRDYIADRLAAYCAFTDEPVIERKGGRPKTKQTRR